MPSEAPKPKPINRLKSMYALRAEVDKMYADGENATEAGKPVAWVMLGQWAEPILTAMGVQSIYPENYGSVCAAAGKAGPYLEISDAEGFPSHVCGYARNCFGYSTKMKELGGAIPSNAPMGGMPAPNLLVASSEICDARFKWFQALGRYFNAPLWTIESPYPGLKESLEPGTDERNIKFLVEQLREFVNFLEQTLHKKIDWDKLDETARGLAAINRLRWEINRLRKARPGPMHSKDLWSTITAAFFRGSESKVILDGFQKMLEEVKQRAENGVSALNVPEKFRLSFDGLPPWHSLDIFDKLAARGWNFVIESNYRPYTPVNTDLSKFADPLERYVRERFQSTNNILNVEYSPEEAASIRKEIQSTGNSTILQIKHVRDCDCDGMVIHILLSCRSASLNLCAMQQKAMDLLKVPALVWEGDMVNASLFDPAEVLKKAEVFEETMTYYQQIRKGSK
ncbi:MAG TPA: 2-hydroxyacyl-CoA dehydratase family protein [Dehalococcoidales bacterium]|nr:2-hydroxyacyl-CoA dehydratase family protein [Dehalococcoidales bacterium]